MGACAILGAGAKFPGCADRAAFWQGLVEQRSFVTELDDARRQLVEKGGRRWGRPVPGAFLPDIDRFDAALFGLAPSAAMFADPRQRLVLEATWAAIEDAGFQRSELAGRRVGVFVAHDGWYLGSYVQRFSPAVLDAQEFIVPGNAPSFLANRLSAAFDLRGPSLVFDTTCSGSYVAMHQACVALERGECELAIVAAVTLFLDPWREGESMATPFESEHGEVASFSRAASGYRTSEGCGSFLLAPDTSTWAASASPYALIIGSGHNCAGKTASFARPSRVELARLYREVLARAGQQPTDVRYVEAHGVGSALGDAEEAAALREVFAVGAGTPCFVSTAEPNLGHCHAASGVYSLLKVLLSFEKQMLAPIRGLDDGELNEAIDPTSELHFLTAPRAWPRHAAGVRRALLASYGMSNVNAALVLEETPIGSPAPSAGAQLIPVSARSEQQLEQQLDLLLRAVKSRRLDSDAPALADVAYTLQLGREAMSTRWLASASSLADLEQRIASFLQQAPLPLATRSVPGVLAAAPGEPLQSSREQWAANNFELAQTWLSGGTVDWSALHAASARRRVHLPGYPFARDRHWADTATPSSVEQPPAQSTGARTTASAAPSTACFELEGSDFFLADHVIQAQQILPAVMHLELARRGLQQLEISEFPLQLADIGWVRPVLVAPSQRLKLFAKVGADTGAGRAIEISSEGDGAPIVHSQARWLPAQGVDRPSPLPLEQLRRSMRDGVREADELYAIPPNIRLEIGARLRGAQRAFLGHNQLLAQLALPAAVQTNALDRFAFHPSLFDPVLQLAYLALTSRARPTQALTIPFALSEFTAYGPCSERMWVWIRYAPGSAPGDRVEKLDIDLCDSDGIVQSAWREFSFRPLAELGRFRSEASLQAEHGPDNIACGASRTEPVLSMLRDVLAGVLHLPKERLDPALALEDLGVDSLVAVRLVAALERQLGPLPKTLLFEFRTLKQLAEHLGARLVPLVAPSLPGAMAPVPAMSTPASANGGDAEPPLEASLAPIAIIGIAGRYPLSPDLSSFWQNLKHGRDCIQEVPSSRWAAADCQGHAERAHQPKKQWGGFLEDIDCFDSLFFGIPPREAELMDPQERLFLECSWAALEDAGYTRERLFASAEKGHRRAGVYAGVMYGEYRLFGVEASRAGAPIGFANTLAGITNRVSYVMDLHGPSMNIDTKCSSSLTAIHVACRDLQLGSIDLAFAGGVNSSLHPAKYLELERRQFLSSSGRCKSFGEGGDGYVPGEGVGVVLLKRLADAERDGDQIHAVIRASAINHGGKTNGYTVPDPNAQASVIADALKRARIAPAELDYVEAHGTGTKLGDPIEIEGLSRALRECGGDSDGGAGRAEPCWIGSVKSNIGHCESAAGIAGLTKLVLQLRHHQLVPSLHSTAPNPHIDFARTPFRVCRELRDWPTFTHRAGTRKRRVGAISSFGAGGANAHVVVEEYIAPARGLPASSAPFLLPLSAKTPEALAELSRRLLGFIRDPEQRGQAELSAVAYTLQCGREACAERALFGARSFDELARGLEAYLADRGAGSSIPAGDARAARWLAGESVDWDGLWTSRRPRPVSLPTYPFARERHWYEQAQSGLGPRELAGVAKLHPLVHRTVSDERGLRFSSTFSPDEPLLSDHRHQGRPLLSAAASLEMARAACRLAYGAGSSPAARISNVVWSAPMPLGGAAEICIAADSGSVPARQGRAFRFETRVSPRDNGEGVVHARGCVCFEALEPCTLNLSARERLPVEIDATELYRRLELRGLGYGASHRVMRRAFRNDSEALVELALPEGSEGADRYQLHPALLDGAFQSVVALDEPGLTASRVTLALPFALDELRVWEATTSRAWARVQRLAGDPERPLAFDIDVCDGAGAVLFALRGLRLLAASAPRSAPALPRPLLATPRFWPLPRASGAEPAHGRDRWIISCGLPASCLESVRERLPDAVCRFTSTGSGGSGEDYCAHAEALLHELQGLPNGGSGILLQLLVPANGPAAALGGLSGMLRCAAAERPGLRTQLLALSPTGFATAANLVQAAAASDQACLRERDNVLTFRSFGPISAEAGASMPWRDDGFYLISGGMGGIGRLFAEEILRNSRHTRVLQLGRSPAPLNGLASLRAPAGQASRAHYHCIDVCNEADVSRLVESSLRELGSLHGIIHAAGVLGDHLLARKSAAELRAVLAPKVLGASVLDEATRHVDLDFFVLFSSLASVFGSPGQADYAAANGFLNHFADNRQQLVESHDRSGRTRSILWPLWRDGGMRMAPERQRALLDECGLDALESAAGLQAFHAALAGEATQLLVASGVPERLRDWVTNLDRLSPPAPAAVPSAARAAGASSLRAAVVDHVRLRLSAVLKLAPNRIGAATRFGDFGLDSVGAAELTRELEKVCGKLSAALLFEHDSIDRLSDYLLERHAVAWLSQLPSVAESAVAADASEPAPEARPSPAERAPLRGSGDVAPSRSVAIIGLSGRYPGARDVNELWSNLREGRCSIEEVPADRWHWPSYYGAAAGQHGRHAGKWGGFLSDVRGFDAELFGLSKTPASGVHPQERLVLEQIWAGIEDAGYRHRELGGARRCVGVYVAAMPANAGGAAAGERDADPVSSTPSLANIANRVSHFFDFSGPSIAIEAMCAASLTAAHLACRDLREGVVDVAIVAAVNTSLHPDKYSALTASGLLAESAECQSFGLGGSGYVPAEAVGVVVLKLLANAEAGGDHVYGLIQGSAVNHNGRSNGYLAPNPRAQCAVVERALLDARMTAESISYVEAHGTGTTVGDAIEFSALAQAFRKHTTRRQFCRIGSIKSNIGHAEAAAGMAALTKVLLQLEHRMLVPSLNATPSNPNIDFSDAPFVVNERLEQWSPLDARGEQQPLIAGISAFGAGGSNAHLIVQEYSSARRPTSRAAPRDALEGGCFLPLSAPSTPQLRELAAALLAWTRALSPTAEVTLRDVAYTLQVGRSAFPERLGLLVESFAELERALASFLAGEPTSASVAGSTHRSDELLTTLAPELPELVLRAPPERRPRLILQLWLRGADLDFEAWFAAPRPRRVSLPGYVFARTRHRLEPRPMPLPARIEPAEAEPPNPEEPLETLVLALLRNTLGPASEPLHATSSFRDNPLQSLQVAAFASLWQATTGHALPVGLLYDAESPRALTQQLVQRGLTAGELAAAPHSARAAGDEVASDMAMPLDLLPMQQAFVVGRRLKTCGRLVSSTLYFELEAASLDAARLTAAWSRLVAHHHALQLRLDDDFRQCSSAPLPEYRIVETDLRGLPAEEQARFREAERRRMAFRHFDLQCWPWFELRLLRLEGDASLILLALDEVCCDALSAHRVIAQLSDVLRDPSHVLPEQRYSYCDYVRYLLALTRRSSYAASVAYWKGKLAAVADSPRLHRGTSDPDHTPVHCLEGRLDPSVWRALEARAAALDCSASALLLACFAGVLAEHTGQSEFRLALTRLNRLPVHEDVMQLVGMFATSNVFVHHQDGSLSWDDRIRRAQVQLDEDAPHAHVPTPLAGRGDSGAASVVFSSFIGSTFARQTAAGPLRLQYALNTTPNVELDHHTFEVDGGLAFRWYVADALFAGRAVQVAFESYQRELQRLAAASNMAPAPAAASTASAPHPTSTALLATAPLEAPMTDVQIAYAFGRNGAGGRILPCALQLELAPARLQPQLLENAWNLLLQRHPRLRQTPLSSGRLRCLNHVPPQTLTTWVEDTVESFERRCQAVRKRLIEHGYPLDVYPPFTVEACQCTSGGARIFMNVDLVLADPPSLLALAEQLLALHDNPDEPLPPLYAALDEGPPAPASEPSARQYWLDKFRTFPPGPALRAVGSGFVERHQLRRRLDCARALDERARRSGATLDAVLLAAFGRVMREWNFERPCSVVAVDWDIEPVSDLTRTLSERTRLAWVDFGSAGDDPDLEIGRVHAILDGDRSQRAVSGLAALRGREALTFSAVFTCPMARTSPRARPAFALSMTPNVIVDCIAERASESELWLHWDSIAADRAREAELFARYCSLLEAWAGSATDTVAPRLPHDGVTLFELLEQALERHSDRCALRFGDESVTYAELERRSRACAVWLQGQGVTADDVVAVLLDRSLEMVVALVAVLRAGAAYMPLDVAAPEARLSELMTKSGARCLLCSAPRERQAVQFSPVPCLAVSPDMGEPMPALAPRAADERSLAYVIYTSGSTGSPKGCMIEHRSIVNRLAWMQDAFALGAGDVVLQKTPYTFDVSVWEFFWPLLVGATLSIARPGGHLDPDYLLNLIERERVTICHFVPSMLRLILDQARLERLAPLRRVVVSGEALDYDLFESFCQKLHIPLENLYGPTEAAVDVSHWRCHANPQRRVSIGSAISGVELYVLNDQMEEVAPGELGELHIGGVAVGRGYLRDAELTARCFVPAPFGTRALLYKTGDLARREADGNILFCGRRDGQVKLNGLRIELGEIEQAIRAHPAVTDAMVALERTGADAQLVAYVVLRDAEQGFDKGSLLRFLRQRLLAHSIPHVWHTVPVIPLSAHGKRQRPSLSSGSVSLRQLEQDPASSAYTNGKGSGSERAALDTSRGIS